MVLDCPQGLKQLEGQEKEPIFMIKRTAGSGTDYPFDALGDADS